MRYLLTLFLLTATMLHAELKRQYIDLGLVESGIKIVDIRTPAEWKSTGLVKGSIPIMFFDEKGRYDVDAFLKALKAKVDTSKPFALICNSGNRTSLVANFLSEKLHFNVIDLKGGILYAIRKNIPLEPYESAK
jgi:rhodanese-related sulfurtransferase